MKKLLITLAVTAGSVAAAQAADTTTLYGSLGFTSQVSDTAITKDRNGNVIQQTADGGEQVISSIANNHWDINQARARIGVKGEENLDNGLDAIFVFELENKSVESPEVGEAKPNNDAAAEGLTGTRDAYVGLRGDFGTVTIGRQGSTWGVVEENYFEKTGPAKEIKHPGRASKTVKYATPDFGGLKFAGRFIADGNDEAALGVDAWDTSLAYENNGIKASVAYGIDYDGYIYRDSKGDAKVVSTGNTESMGAQVGYENEQYGVFANAQHQSSANTVYNVQGKYKFGPNQVRAGLGYEDVRNSNTDNYSVGLGYQYNFSQRTSTWVEGAYRDQTKGNKDGNFAASVGIRHDF